MVRLLNGHPVAMVKFPDNVKMREYVNMIQARELLADDVIGYMDGDSFLMECTSKPCSRMHSTVAKTATPW